jgi:hypothetical protein
MASDKKNINDQLNKKFWEELVTYFPCTTYWESDTKQAA